MSFIRSILRKQSDDPLIAEMRQASTFDIAKWARGAQKGSFKQIAAELELERRNFWKNFFTSSLVAWVALVVSILSFALSVAKYFNG